jgi:hypothetical protein
MVPFLLSLPAFSPRYPRESSEMPCFWTRLDLSRCTKYHVLHACACHRYSIVDMPLFNVQAKTTAKLATLKVSSASAALDCPSGLGMVKKTSLEHKAPHSLDSCSVRRRAGYGEYRKPSVFCGLAYRLDRRTGI